MHESVVQEKVVGWNDRLDTHCLWMAFKAATLEKTTVRGSAGREGGYKAAPRMSRTAQRA